MKDETADNIAKELRPIREGLQKLTSAVKSVAHRSQNSNKSERSYRERNSLPFEPGSPDRNRQPVRRPENKRRQWHQMISQTPHPSAWSRAAFCGAESRAVGPLEGGTILASDWLRARQGSCGHSLSFGTRHRGIAPTARRARVAEAHTGRGRKHPSRNRFQLLDSRDCQRVAASCVNGETPEEN
jgi:hypothetical protein